MSRINDKEKSNLQKLLVILEKDYEELTISERAFLRNRIRERYSLEGKVPEEQMFNGYLILKLKHITPLETITFCPQPMECDFGPFVGIKNWFSPIPILAFKGINGDKTRNVIISGHTTLPVLTVSYMDNYTEVTCLLPDGDFCKIRSTDFKFDI